MRLFVPSLVLDLTIRSPGLAALIPILLTLAASRAGASFFSLGTGTIPATLLTLAALLALLSLIPLPLTFRCLTAATSVLRHKSSLLRFRINLARRALQSRCTATGCTATGLRLRQRSVSLRAIEPLKSAVLIAFPNRPGGGCCLWHPESWDQRHHRALRTRQACYDSGY